jgi:hypothetical protein
MKDERISTPFIELELELELELDVIAPVTTG